MAELNFRPDYLREIKGINIQVIAHKEQACGITGEWWTDENGVVQIRVSRLGDIRAEALHIAHEVVEWAASVGDPLAMDDDLTNVQDEKFLKLRREGKLPKGHEEVGFGPNCLYAKGHHLGTATELILCQNLGLNWIDYDNRVCQVAFEGKEFDF